METKPPFSDKEEHTWLKAYSRAELKVGRRLSPSFAFFLSKVLSSLVFIPIQICLKKKIHFCPAKYKNVFFCPIPSWLPGLTNTIRSMRILCVALQYLIMLLGPEKFICDPGWQLF